MRIPKGHGLGGRASAKPIEQTNRSPPAIVSSWSPTAQQGLAKVRPLSRRRRCPPAALRSRRGTAAGIPSGKSTRRFSRQRTERSPTMPRQSAVCRVRSRSSRSDCRRRARTWAARGRRTALAARVSLLLVDGLRADPERDAKVDRRQRGHLGVPVTQPYTNERLGSTLRPSTQSGMRACFICRRVVDPASAPLKLPRLARRDCGTLAVRPGPDFGGKGSWRTTPLYRAEEAGSWADDSPPPLPDTSRDDEVQRVGSRVGPAVPSPIPSGHQRCERAPGRADGALAGGPRLRRAERIRDIQEGRR